MGRGIQQDTATPAPSIITIPLFKTSHEGFGNERLVSEGAYHRVYGSIDPRWPGRFHLGLRVRSLASTSYTRTPIFATEWTASDGVSPLVYYIAGARVMVIQNGALSQVGSDFPDNATGGMFDDNGSGIPYLYACFSGVAADAKYIRRMDRAQTFTTSVDAVAHRLLSLNGKAYRSITPTGGTVNCRVSVCPSGSDRFLAASWGTPQAVGLAGTEVNALVGLRQSPVAIKPEGIYAYSDGLDRWVNYGHFGDHHPDNGKGSYSMGDYIIVPMGSGGAVHFDGFNARSADPITINSSPGLHTTSNALQVVGQTQHWMVAATKPVAKTIAAGDSLNVLTEIGGVFA